MPPFKGRMSSRKVCRLTIRQGVARLAADSSRFSFEIAVETTTRMHAACPAMPYRTRTLRRRPLRGLPGPGQPNLDTERQPGSVINTEAARH